MVSPFVKQTWTVMGVLSNMHGQGMILSYSSILLPSLRAPDSDIKVDLDTASLIASVIGIASMPGFLISSILMESFGRKFAYIVLIIPGIIGWVFIYFAESVPSLILGRILGGFSTGATVFLGAVIIGEYTSPKNRGLFLNLKTVAVCIGYMTLHILGHFCNWRTVALISLIPQILAFLIVCTWPESPAWLASKKKFEQSETSFYWLRGRTVNSIPEIQHLITAQKGKSDFGTSRTFKSKISVCLKKFTKRNFIHPLIIITFSAILIESCGRHVFPAYALQIIDEVIGNKNLTIYYTLGIDIIITASAMFSSVLVKICKRRTLLFSSGFAALFILYITSGYLFLVNIKILPKDQTFIPIILLMTYFISCNLGCTSIPLALLGEIFPLEHRGVGACVSGFVLSFALLLAMQITPYLLVYIKVYGTFAVFGTTMGLSLIMLWFILPETKDKTLQDIEDFFNTGKFRINADDDTKLKMLTKFGDTNDVEEGSAQQ